MRSLSYLKQYLITTSVKTKLYQSSGHFRAQIPRAERHQLEASRALPTDQSLRQDATIQTNHISDTLRLAARRNPLTQHNRSTDNRHATRLPLVIRLPRDALPQNRIALHVHNPHHFNAPGSMPARALPGDPYARGPCTKSVNSIESRGASVQDLRCTNWRAGSHGSFLGARGEGA